MLAHGVAAAAPILPDVLLAWSFDPTVVIPVVLAAALYLAAVRSVDRAHPATHVPTIRSVCWLLGLGAIVVALQSPIERYDTTLFSVHMIQHILLTLIAPPLLALGAPVTLLLRAVRPETRRRVILPILHSVPIRVMTFPVVTWLLFALAMWGTHFSPISTGRSRSRPSISSSTRSTSWPAASSGGRWSALDPSPWRMREPARILYTFLRCPRTRSSGSRS